MPVRISELSKKLGVSPEEILAKAKELGISAARVESSTLDKITAEFLEEQLLLLRTDLRAEQPTLPLTPLVASEPAPQPAPPPPHISVTAPVLPPKTQPSFSGGPPRPPKITAQDLEDQPGDPGKLVYLLDPMVVRDLAAAIGLKPFVVIADLLELKLFKRPDDMVDFETASVVARKHGYQAQRPPPGVLIL